MKGKAVDDNETDDPRPFFLYCGAFIDAPELCWPMYYQFVGNPMKTTQEG